MELADVHMMPLVIFPWGSSFFPRAKFANTKNPIFQIEKSADEALKNMITASHCQDDSSFLFTENDILGKRWILHQRKEKWCDTFLLWWIGIFLQQELNELIISLSEALIDCMVICLPGALAAYIHTLLSYSAYWYIFNDCSAYCDTGEFSHGFLCANFKFLQRNWKPVQLSSKCFLFHLEGQANSKTSGFQYMSGILQ